MLSTMWIVKNWRWIGTGALIIFLSLWVGSLYLERGIARGQASAAQGEVKSRDATIKELRAEIKVQNASVDDLRRSSITRQEEADRLLKENAALRGGLTYAADAAHARISAMQNKSTSTSLIDPVTTPAPVISPSIGCIKALHDISADLKGIK